VPGHGGRRTLDETVVAALLGVLDREER